MGKESKMCKKTRVQWSRGRVAYHVGGDDNGNSKFSQI